MVEAICSLTCIKITAFYLLTSLERASNRGPGSYGGSSRELGVMPVHFTPSKAVGPRSVLRLGDETRPPMMLKFNRKGHK